jgi:hypothetical protein
MKHAKEAARLEAIGLTVELPKPNYNFDRYKHDLQDLIYENFGYEAKKSFDFDETSGQFYWTCQEAGRILTIGQTHITFRVTLHLDPKQPIAPQIVAAHATIEQMKQHSIFVYRALAQASDSGEIDGKLEI